MKTGKVRIVQMLLLIGMTVMIALLVYGNLEKKNLAVMLLLLFYFLWNIWTMHQLMKSRAVAVEELERSNLLISCVICLCAQKRKKEILFMVPVLLVFLVCLLSPVNGEIRYMLPIMLMLPLDVAWCARVPERKNVE